jgi:hypothetical protein
MSLSLPKDLSGACLDDQGKQVGVFDVYEEALSGYSIERIEQACTQIVESEKFFPAPAVIIEYCRRLPAPDQNQITEAPRTPDQLRRTQLVKAYWLAPFRIEDDDERKAAFMAQNQAGLERYIKNHWNDNTKGR